MPPIKYKYNSLIFIMQLIRRLISFLYSNLPKLAILLIAFFAFKSTIFAGNLTSLEVVGYEESLEPAFSPTTYNYSITISSSEIELLFNYTKENSSDSVSTTGLGNTFIQNNSGTVSLNVGGTIYNINYTKVATQRYYEFDYTGHEEYFDVPVDGYYQLETWGAQGGTNGSGTGGYGGYAVGTIHLTRGTRVYVNVGGQGQPCSSGSCTTVGGYNGGGNAYAGSQVSSGGGGATHFATHTGLLSDLEEYKGELNTAKNVYESSTILIVAGGGGGGGYYSSYIGYGGHGGGFNGCSGWDAWTNTYKGYAGDGGKQTSGGGTYNTSSISGSSTFGSFGLGSSTYFESFGHSGGGGGFYGGGTSSRGHGGAGGGSGYIANPK